MWDELDEAIYRTVHEYRDGNRAGAVALAPRINMNAGTLSNKANPGMEQHQLTLRESIPLQLATGRTDIAAAYAQALGGVYVPLGDFSGTSDTELLNIWAGMDEQDGRMAGAAREVLEDGRVTREELRRLKREVWRSIQVRLEFYHRMEAICDD